MGIKCFHLLTCARASRDKRKLFRLCSGIKILSTKIKEFQFAFCPTSASPRSLAGWPEIRREILGDKGKPSRGVGTRWSGAIRAASASAWRKQIKFNQKLNENKLDYLIKKPDARRGSRDKASPLSSTIDSSSSQPMSQLSNPKLALDGRDILLLFLYLSPCKRICICVRGCYPQVYCYYACSRHAIRQLLGEDLAGQLTIPSNQSRAHSRLSSAWGAMKVLGSFSVFH